MSELKHDNEEETLLYDLLVLKLEIEGDFYIKL